MNTNTKPARCARCLQAIAIGEGRFVGTGKVVHKATCTPAYRPPASKKKLFKAAIDFLAPCLLAAVVVIGTAAAGSGDYILVTKENGIGVGSCAKSADDCEAAREAAWNGWLPGVPAGTPSRCDPSPNCFPAVENFISGFNMPAHLEGSRDHNHRR